MSEQRFVVFETLPDRLAKTDLTHEEYTEILSQPTDELGDARTNFNWVAAYLLHHNVLHEDEIGDWFFWEDKTTEKYLDGQRPIDIWPETDGFERVFEYAKQFRQEVDEAFA